MIKLVSWQLNDNNDAQILEQLYKLQFSFNNTTFKIFSIILIIYTP